jgi:hypothetical protein
MISNTTDLRDAKVRQLREWRKPGADRLLSLAAAPTFAVMALLTVFGVGSPDALCSMAGASPLGGMVPMYLLMSAFHLAPWLKLISRRRSGTCGS